MNLGNELKRDTCPEKYYKKRGFVKDVLPMLISIVIVGIVSGIFMKKGGANIVTTLVIEIIFVLLGTAFFSILTSGAKKRLSQQHISVCDNGICGVCPLNAYKNQRFELAYTDISEVSSNGEKLTITADTVKVNLIASDADATAALIHSKITEILEKQN